MYFGGRRIYFVERAVYVPECEHLCLYVYDANRHCCRCMDVETNLSCSVCQSGLTIDAGEVDVIAVLVADELEK